MRIMELINRPKAVTEESTRVETDREDGAQTETPSRRNPAEVPS